MGKTKTKIIDDSLPVEEPKVKKPSKKPGRQEDTLVEKLKAELGIEEKPVIASEAKQSTIQKEIAGPHSSSVGPPSAPRNDKVKKPGKAKPRSKKYQQVIKDLDRSKSYPIPEAVDMVKKLSYAKFNATLEAHINTAQMGVRGLVSLPYAAGKLLRILAFGKGADTSGAAIFGTDEIIEQINEGKVDFDLLITTPEWMPKLAKVAKVLGPRGLMPNPKNGTIVSGEDGLKKAVESFQAGKTEYKTEPKAPVIHLGLGKLNQPTEELSQNVKVLLSTLGKSRVKKVSLSPTMGPSVKVDLSSL